MFKKDEWFKSVTQCKNDAIAAVLVGFAIIPESIAFSLIAGVDPKVGIYASICILILTSIFGGRPALISAATGAMALVLVGVVKNYGIEYMFAASILAGILQIVLGYFKVAKLMSFVPRSVMVGFVNALAILIFVAQVPELKLSNTTALILCAFSLGIIYLFPLLPKVGKILPSGLVAIVVVSLISYFGGLDVRMIKDLGELPSNLPSFWLPDVPFNLETFKIIFPYSLSLAVVGILESLMTSSLIDEITSTTSNKNKECFGQGIANISTGFFGGMAGCGMIGQSMINVKSGARTRLSTFLAGVYLCLIILFLADFVNLIPMAVLVAIMIMVSIGTFDYGSIKRLKTFPLSSNIVMLATVIITIMTGNLALGVLVGVLFKALFFANKVSQFMQCKKTYNKEKTEKTYKFYGQIFFTSSEKFYNVFDFNETLNKVTIDVSKAHFWDVSAIYALDKVVAKLRHNGILVEVCGQNLSSRYMLDKFSVINDEKALKKLVGGH